MTLDQFKEAFRCTFEVIKSSSEELTAVSKAINRHNGEVVDSIKTTIDIMKTSQWIADSKTQLSLSAWNWDLYMDKVKRTQLDWFAVRAPIEDFFPNNSSVDISTLYM